MKVLLISLSFIILCTFSNIHCGKLKWGETEPPPTKMQPKIIAPMKFPRPEFYETMEFEWKNRGTWNVSMCLKDFITCLEVIRPDMLCRHATQGDKDFRWLESICGELQNECDEVYGYYELQWKRYTLFESTCMKIADMIWT